MAVYHTWRNGNSVDAKMVHYYENNHDFNGGQSVGTFPVILVKLATSSLPLQITLNFKQNGSKWVLFRAQHYLGGEWRNEGMNPKAIENLLSGAELYVTITWHRFFLELSQVVLASIVGMRAPEIRMRSSHRATGERKICCCLLVHISKTMFVFRRLKFRVMSWK